MEEKLKRNFLKFLRKNPVYIQNLFGELYLKFGLPLELGPIKYAKFYNSLKESQWWPRWRLEKYQMEKLSKLLSYVYDNVPYYTETFKKLNLKPEDINSIEDLKKIPILTKRDIAENFDKLTASKVKKRYLRLMHTSGSTGESMKFYRDKRYEFTQLAFVQRQFDSINAKLYDKYIYLWSDPFVEEEIKDIYLYEPHLKRLSLSSVPPSPNLWSEYIRLIKQFNPICVRGNPSMLYHLACYAQEMDINDIKFDYFISYFENLFSYQKEFVEKQFKSRVHNYYSMKEWAISAFECAKREGMHIDMERGILEILGNNSEALPEGCLGRIIATGLHNFAMPLIRYDTGDVGLVMENACSCGRRLPLLNLSGRANEVIRYKDKIFYSTDLSVLPKLIKNIRECQLIQENDKEIKVNIIKREKYSEKDTQDVIRVLKNMIDGDLNIIISFVDHIPRTKMGKFALVVSKMKPDV